MRVEMDVVEMDVAIADLAVVADGSTPTDYVVAAEGEISA